MKTVTIVMYHYVRELPFTRYPGIKGLLASEFKSQIAYLSKYYEFVTMEDCIQAVYGNKDMPSNAVLLTFDDGYMDQFVNVFPLLEERGIQGSFFPPAKAVLEHKVLDVNKIHFILACAGNVHDLIKDIFLCLDEFRSEHSLESNEAYFARLAQANRFDSKEIVFVKRLLQRELAEQLRAMIVDRLFKKYVTKDEENFSRELYMSLDQIKCMARNGMYIGSHGYDHYWLSQLSEQKQEQEIDLSLQFLRQVGSSLENWVMCYPYGVYNDSLIQVIKRKNCKLALTTEVQIAGLNRENAFILPRLDTNDLPKFAEALPDAWTKKVLKVAV